jgi:hypothetical protein
MEQRIVLQPLGFPEGRVRSAHPTAPSPARTPRPVLQRRRCSRSRRRGASPATTRKDAPTRGTLAIAEARFGMRQRAEVDHAGLIRELVQVRAELGKVRPALRHLVVDAAVAVDEFGVRDLLADERPRQQQEVEATVRARGEDQSGLDAPPRRVARGSMRVRCRSP